MYEQYQLPYSVNALEPYIDGLTVETHHGKHHAAYTANLNRFAAEAGVDGQPIEELLANLGQIEDPALRTAVKNNGGGFYNHNLYFMTLSPEAKHEPTGELADKIVEKFGSFEAMKDELAKKAAGQFGSGWAWLSADKDGDLRISATSNQDNPLMEGEGFRPIVALDVWEHAYYLKYKNLRADYIKAFFEVLDWKKVEELYKAG
ncbi:MAG: superoxide dismutase [Lachnospiraceae bacterium]|nr:superoxide dismutase [Lachnospiraceae bacterium]